MSAVIEGTTNLVRNPSFETNSTDWISGVGAGATGSWARTSGDAWVGTWARVIEITASTVAAGAIMASQRVSQTTIPVTAGLVYSISAAFKVSDLDIQAELVINWYDSGGAFMVDSQSLRINAIETDDWRRARASSILAPAGAAFASPQIRFYDMAGGTLCTVKVDALQFEQKDKVTDYCDGTIAGCSWTGTAHASTSVRPDVEMPHVARGRSGAIELRPELWTATKDNALLENITEFVVDGFVELDYLRDVKMIATFEMTDPDLVRPYRDYLAPFLGMVYPDGTVERHQLGLYWCEPPRKTFTPRGGRAFLDGRDLTALLMDWTTSSTYKVDSGTKYSTALKTFLQARGFTRLNVHDNGRTVPRGGLSWPPGTNGMQIANSLAEGCGMYSPFADRFGVVTTFPYISRKNRKPVKVYTGGDDGAVIEPFEVTLVERPVNRVTVYRELSDGVQIKATKENKSPASSTSTVNIGIRDLFVQDGAIESNAAAAERAQELLEEYGSLEVSATFWTLPEPWHDVHELYELALTYVDGTPITQATGLFWATGWKIGFSPQSARMQHSLKRFVDLSAY